MALVVKDLEEAHRIIEDTQGKHWGDAITHSEPKVLIAAAMVARECLQKVDELVGAVNELNDKLREVSGD